MLVPSKEIMQESCASFETARSNKRDCRIKAEIWGTHEEDYFPLLYFEHTLNAAPDTVGESQDLQQQSYDSSEVNRTNVDGGMVYTRPDDEAECWCETLVDHLQGLGLLED